MSKAHQPGGSRPALSRLPSTKSVLPDFGDLSESEQTEFLRDVLLTADSTTDHDVLTKVAEFVEEYPERARLPISTTGELRARYVEFVEAVWEAEDYEDGQWKSSEVSEFQPKRAMCWADAVSLTLQRYRSAEQTELHFGHDDGSTFSVEASNRWKPAYQEKQLAKMHGWLRQAAGGDYDHVENVPDGITVQGRYDNPKLVLFTRGASSKPDVRFTPGEHEGAVAASWSTVYDAIRNVARSLDVEAWSYDGRSEPHPGRGYGINACYGHEHVVLVVDSDRPTHEIRAEFRRVAEAHVRATPTAGDKAHDLDRPLSEWSDPAAEIDTCQVFDLDDDDCPIENVAGYVGAYASLDADDGLFERPIEYVAWAATKDALNTRTMRRSESAVEMADDDLQTILGHSPEAHATVDPPGDGQDDDADRNTSESDATGDGLAFYSDWGGKAGRVGSPARSDVLADAVRSRADPDADVADVVADMERSGWDLSTAVVEVAFADGRIQQAIDRLDGPTVPAVAGRFGGDVSPEAVAWVLDGRDLDADLAEYIRDGFDADADPAEVIDELDERKVRVTPERVGATLGRDGFDYDQEQTEFVERSGWSLEAITTGKGTDAEETEEVGGKSSVEMVEVETARDEYEDMWVVPPKYIDSPADLIDDNDRTVFWRYRNGVAFGGDVGIDGGYIRENWGDVPMRDWWDYVQPHEAGTPEPEFPPLGVA